MDLIAIESGGRNLVAWPLALAQPSPAVTVRPALVEVWWRYQGEPHAAARLIGTYLPGQRVSFPYTPVGDKNLILSTVSISARGVRSVASLRDAPEFLVTFTRETDAPTVAQIGTSTHTLITLAIGNYSQFAWRRRVRTADDAGMSVNLDEQVIEIAAGQILPRVLYLNRPDPGAGARTIYVRISHSSGGAYGAESAATAFTWADDGGSGGTGGSGDGTGGDTLPCFSGNVRVRTPAGYMSFDELRELTQPFAIVNEMGSFPAELIVHHFKGEMIDMGGGELVTFEHLMKVRVVGAYGRWIRAQHYFVIEPRVKFEGDVFNLHILSEDPADHHYCLENGEVAHNVKNDG